MNALPPILLAAGALLSCAGLAVLAALPRWWRNALLPAVPALGALALVVTLHATALILPTRFGAWVVLAVAAGVLGWRTWTDRSWWRLDRRSTALALAALVCGAAPAAVALGPVRTHGARVVEVTLNNDAYAYVSVASWLHDHRATARPVVGADPPAYAYAAAHLDFGLRIGEELVLSAISEVAHNDPEQDWYAWSCLLLFLIPGSVAGAFRALRMNGWVGLVGGTVAAVSALLSFQVFNSNTDALMGVVIAPLAISVIAAHFGSFDEHRPPIWLTAGALAGLAGTYPEYLPVIGAGILLFIVVRPPGQWLHASATGLAVLALAAVLAPLVWYDAIRSARVLSIAGIGTSSPFVNVPASVSAARLLGLARLDGYADHPVYAWGLGIALAVLVVVGIIGHPRWRWLFAGMALNMAGAVTVLGRDRGYSQVRAAEVAVPLMIILAAAGAEALVRQALDPERRHALRAGAVCAAAAALVAGVALGGLNVRTSRAQVRAASFGDRYVTADYAEAAAWITRHASASGDGAAVLDEDFFQQLWLVYSTRAMRNVAYPLLFSDYMQRTAFTPAGPHRPIRWVVAGTHEIIDTAPSTVVESNAHFRLLDLSRGGALVVAAIPPAYTDLNGGANWIGLGGGLVVVRSGDVTAVSFTAQTSVPNGGVTTFAMGQQIVTAGASPTDARAALPAGAVAELPFGPPAPARGRFWVHFGSIRRG